MLCFIGSKRPAQVAHEVAQGFEKVIEAHLIEGIAPLFIWLNDETKYFFAGQLCSVFRFSWCSSTLSVNVGEIPLTSCKNPFQGMRDPRGSNGWGSTEMKCLTYSGCLRQCEGKGTADALVVSYPDTPAMPLDN